MTGALRRPVDSSASALGCVASKVASFARTLQTFDESSVYDEPMISLSPATAADRSVVAHLMQLYAYDWSELMPLDVGDDGRFEAYALDPYWQDALYHPLLLRVGEKLAGFALVVGKSQLTGRIGVFDMAEFFVLRRYRGKGVGLEAALMAFDRFEGPWEIRQRTENPGATAFWRRAVAAYTSAPFEELSWNDDKWTGPVQRFSK